MTDPSPADLRRQADAELLAGGGPIIAGKVTALGWGRYEVQVNERQPGSWLVSELEFPYRVWGRRRADRKARRLVAARRRQYARRAAARTVL